MNKTVLIVDDTEDIRFSLAELVEVLMGWNTVIASNGKEGQDVIKNSHSIDIILSDLEMSPVNGVEFYEAIKDTGIPFILMSGHEDAPIIAKELGIAFIKKPYNVLDLSKILSGF